MAATLAMACMAPAQAEGPVATVRVAFDRDGITATQVHGLADRDTRRAVTADDPVRIASISKLVTAIAVMRLVEAGSLDLDADVGEQLGWPLRNPAYPDAPITLRLLLSHRSSLTDGAGYWQTPLGGELRTLLQDPRAWDASHAPGSFFRYANLNFPLVAQVMERATGERYDRLMRRLVLEPLGLDACFNWSGCSDQAVAHAVVLYDASATPVKDDLHGQRPPCPVIPADDGDCDLAQWRAGDNGALFSPQGGLRISANGLARIGRLLLGEGKVDGVRLLSPASVRTLAAPQWVHATGDGITFEEDTGDRNDGFFCRYGLAMQTLASPAQGCRDDPFGDGIARIGHSGSAYGLQAGLWLDTAHGTGVVWYATGMPDAREGGRSAFSAVEERLARGAAADEAPPVVAAADLHLDQLQAGTRTWLVYFHGARGSGIQRTMLATSETTRAQLDGRDAWIIEQHWEDESGEVHTARTVHDAGDFSTVSQTSAWKRPDRSLATTVIPAEGRGSIEGDAPPEMRARMEQGFATMDDGWWLNWHSDLAWIPLLPWERGGTLRVHLFDVGMDGPLDVDYTVLGERILPGADGNARSTWLVETESGRPGSGNYQRFWIDQASRVVLKEEDVFNGQYRSKVLLSVPAVVEFPIPPKP